MNKSRHIAVVLAGGSGRRMGGNMPKQYMQLAGRTVLEYSIEAFDANGRMAMTHLIFPSQPYNKLTIKGKAKAKIYSIR